MAVLWKNGAAPIVVPGMRVVIAMSVFVVRVAIYPQELLKTDTSKDKAYPRKSWRGISIRAENESIVLRLEGVGRTLIGTSI
jgi:hypothetical protein